MAESKLRPSPSGKLSHVMHKVNWVRLGAVFLVLVTCGLSMSAMAVGNWATMQESSSDGLVMQTQSYEWGPLIFCIQFQNISNAAIPSASVNASIVYNDTSVSYCGQYGKGFNDDWPSAAWIACMFLFNSGSACAALAVITSILSLFWNTDKASASFSVCATLFFFISVFVFPAGFGGSLPAQTVSAMDDVNQKPVTLYIPKTRVCGDAGATYLIGDCSLGFAVGFNIAVIFTIAAAAVLYHFSPKYAERMKARRARTKGVATDAEIAKYKGYM